MTLTLTLLHKDCINMTLTLNMSLFRQEHEQIKKQMEKTQGELAEVKKECHKRKKMLVAQQQILQDGANAYNKVICI